MLFSAVSKSSSRARFKSAFIFATRNLAGENRLDPNPKRGVLTREEALRTYTTDAAYGMFQENLKGSLEPGKLADFIVISDDYFKCPEESIKDIKVLRTVIGGKTVWEA